MGSHLTVSSSAGTSLAPPWYSSPSPSSSSPPLPLAFPFLRTKHPMRTVITVSVSKTVGRETAKLDRSPGLVLTQRLWKEATVSYPPRVRRWLCHTQQMRMDITQRVTVSTQHL